MPQSLMRNVMAALPKPSASALAVITRRASALGKPDIRAGVLDDAVVAEGFFHGGGIGQRAVHGPNHRANRDAVLFAEFEIALIVRGHRHDRAGAVAHQHEVADPDGNLLAAERIDGVAAREQAFLLDVARTFGGPRIDHLLHLRLQLRAKRVERPADAPARESRRSRRRSCRRAW